jgi:putative PIN family toxin of toxin-antitoxin system
MIVFDASTIVGAALKVDSIPERALFVADEADIFALSTSVDAEITDVLGRPKFASAISSSRRERILSVLRDSAIWFEPVTRVADCRDPKDNQYLELALASGAEIIVSSDDDLLVLDPWRGTRILRPASYLTFSRSYGSHST